MTEQEIQSVCDDVSTEIRGVVNFKEMFENPFRYGNMIEISYRYDEFGRTLCFEDECSSCVSELKRDLLAICKDLEKTWLRWMLKQREDKQ